MSQKKGNETANCAKHGEADHLERLKETSGELRGPLLLRSSRDVPAAPVARGGGTLGRVSPRERRRLLRLRGAHRSDDVGDSRRRRSLKFVA